MAKSVIPAESEPLRLNQLLAHIDVIHNEATMTLIEAIADEVARFRGETASLNRLLVLEDY